MPSSRRSSWPRNRTHTSCISCIPGRFFTLWATQIKTTVRYHFSQKVFNTQHYAVLCLFSHVRLFVTPWTIASQAPLAMEFSKKECWSALPFPTPGDVPNTGIKPGFLMSPALAGGFFTTSTTWQVPPVRMAIIKKKITTNNKCLRGCGKREPSCTVGGNVNWYTTMENNVEIPLKIRNKLTIWPSNPTTGQMPWENHNSKRHVYPNVHHSTVYNS